MLHTFTISTTDMLRGQVIDTILRECYTLHDIELLSLPQEAGIQLRVTTPDRGIWEWNEEIIPTTDAELSALSQDDAR